MEVKCEYCGNLIDDKLANCPHCGATNDNMKRTADFTPKTIEELQKWYKDHHLPPYETTRFFIGTDYKGKKAFGIYEDAGEFIVYKNKADGTRAIRYQGKDEAYAVNELYLKLKSEILNQKANNGKSSVKNSGKTAGKRLSPEEQAKLDKKNKITLIIVSTIAAIIALVFLVSLFHYAPILVTVLGLLPIVVIGLAKILDYFSPMNAYSEFVGAIFDEGSKKYGVLAYSIYVLVIVSGGVSIARGNIEPVYYRYDDTYYVNFDNSYYMYDYDTSDYTPVSKEFLPVEIQNNPVDYEYDAANITWDSGLTFKESNYYEENLKSTYESSSSSDSDYDWDSGSDWDSGGSDWDSDW